MATDTKKYLEYLDKEMTIMGILSAVAIAAPAGALNSLLGEGAGIKNQLLGAGPFFVIVGSAASVIAALCFYKQRSLLAWYYGQICFIESLENGTSNQTELQKYMCGADSWETWIPYSWGFTALNVGLVEYVAAAFLVLADPNSTWFRIAKLTGRIFPLLAIPCAFLQWYVFRTYTFDDAPWTAFRWDVRHLFGTKLPHDQTYTRLKPSPISGVGVFAIRDIPKGTNPFEPDNERLISVKVGDIQTNESELRRLYEDFCVLKDDRYECPESFNELTPSWYLNNSDNPNVEVDLFLRFHAIRDIKAGEELTADYGTYSDNKLTSQP